METVLTKMVQKLLKYIKSLGHEKLFRFLKVTRYPNNRQNRFLCKGLAALDIEYDKCTCCGWKEMMKAAMEGILAGTPAGVSGPINSRYQINLYHAIKKKKLCATETVVEVPFITKCDTFAQLTQDSG